MHRFNLALAVRRLACRCHGHAGILALLLLALTAAPASAQVWNRSGGGTWANNSTNVSPTYVNGGPATFNNTTGGTITLSGAITPSDVIVDATAGTYTFTGAGMTGATLFKSGAGTLARVANGMAVDIRSRFLRLRWRDQQCRPSDHKHCRTRWVQQQRDRHG